MVLGGCARFLLSWLLFLLFVFSSFPFSISIWTSICFVSSCLFLEGIMLSPRVLLRLVQRFICI